MKVGSNHYLHGTVGFTTKPYHKIFVVSQDKGKLRFFGSGKLVNRALHLSMITGKEEFYETINVRREQP